MRKHVLSLLFLFAGVTLAIGQIDTVTAPFVAPGNGYDWGMGDWQVGSEVIVQAEYQTTNADSAVVVWLDLDAGWATVTASTTVVDGGTSGKPVDGVINDTVMLPLDFPLRADFPDHIILLQVRAYYSDGTDAWSNGSFSPVAAYTDSLAVNIAGYADSTQLGDVNLGDTLMISGWYGIEDITSVQIDLMHLNSGWATVKDYTMEVFNPANEVGVKDGHFKADFIIPEDFNTVLDLAEGDFFVVRVFAKYGDGTNVFFFSWLNVVDLNVSGVSLSLDTLSLDVGASHLLEAAIAPETAEDKSVTWSSSDESVALVEQNGLVNGLTAGTATIYVITTDGGFMDSCFVNVGGVGVEMHGLEGVSTYPNPAQDVLNIEGLNAGTYKVSVYSVTGAMLKRMEMEGTRMNRLPVGDLSPGIYLLDISGDEGRLVQKFSKR
jgi:hypothetical protein